MTFDTVDNPNANKIAVFKNKQIRRIIFNDEWWFSIIDVVGA